MGNEQSGSNGKNSKVDGSYSKPIGDPASVPRGKLLATASLQSDSPALSAAGEVASAVKSRRTASARRATLATSASSHTAITGRDIVVVHEGKKVVWEEQAPELKHLSEIPMFGPLIRNSQSSGSLALSSPKEIKHFGEKLDHRAIHHFCMRYQEHLKQCAEAVTFDQTTLCNRMKEVDFDIKCLHDMLAERQKKYSRFTDQLSKVHEMSQVLTRARTTANSLAHLLDLINSSLPSEQQLEPFTFLPHIPSPQHSNKDTSSHTSAMTSSNTSSVHGSQAAGSPTVSLSSLLPTPDKSTSLTSN